MVVYFDEGVNRIWYKPLDFQTGLKIQIQLWNPDLIKQPLSQIFTEFDEGLYYLNHSFNKRGSWVGIVFEDGVKKAFTSFSIGMKRPGVVTQRKIIS